jgi:ketosteroid isomerase-like protein
MSITKEEVAEAVRDFYAVWKAGDMKAAARIDANAIGFGFRTAAWRDLSTRGGEAYLQMLEQFLDQMDYYRLDLEELHTSAEGDIGLAGGVHTEDFKVKGRPPERARVRFSLVLKKGAAGWQVLLFHRDIQPFDEEGRYPTTLTEVSPNN